MTLRSTGSDTQAAATTANAATAPPGPATLLPLAPTGLPDLADSDSAVGASAHLRLLTEHQLSAAQPLSVAEQQTQPHLTTITDALPVLISYIDRERCYRFVNRAYETWFGRPRAEILGRNMLEVLGPEAVNQLQPYVDQALGGEAVTFQRALAYAHGPERFVEATYVPHRDAQGLVDGYTALVLDISERRRLEASRNAALGRTARLMQITAALTEAVSPPQVFEAVVNHVAITLNASSGGLFVLDEEAGVVQLLHSVGYAESACQALRAVPLDSNPSIPALDTIRSGIPLWFASQAELLRSYPNLAPVVSPSRSYQVACLPIFVQRRALGAVAFSFDDVPALDPEQQNFLLLVARYSGQALERLRLLEAERKSRERAEASAQRSSLLSRASRALAEAGDRFSGVLDVIAEQVANDYCDLCCIALLKDNRLDVSALHHKRPETAILLRSLLGAEPAFTPAYVDSLAKLTKSRLLSSQEMLALSEQLPATYAAWATTLGTSTAVLTPLTTRSGVIGVVFALRETGSSEFTDQDLRFFEDLAERCALAIESTRLYQEHQHSRARTELLYALARAVIGAKDVEAVLRAALDTLEQALGTSRSAILTLDAEGVMRFRAWRGLSADYRSAVEGHSPWEKNERNPKPILVADARHDATLAGFSTLFGSENIGALGFIPLVTAGKLIGKFMVYYDAPRALTAQELQMAKAIANHVAAAVSRFSALDDLRETVRFNELFTGILGHDLRNPLGAIMTSAQLALRRATHERNTRPLARILTSGARMSRMIDQLLDFTRVRVGSGIPIERNSVELVTLLQQVTDELVDAYPGWNVQVEHSGNTQGDWDADRLAQVFSNLIANALQHGSLEQVRISINGEHSDWVAVEVHNHGTIEAELLPKLFEPMAGGGQRRHRSQGLGLGLYITQQIIKSHGGEIEVRSDAEFGTAFRVKLARVAPAQVVLP